MKYYKSAAIITAALISFCLHPLSAQSNGPEGDVKIISNPDESIVTLDGEYKLTGRTPYVIVHDLKGFYKINARKHGYEDYNAIYMFNPGVRKKLAIKLNKKSREKAFLRSLVLPGWGQHYTDQKWKGLFVASLQIGSLAYLGYTEYQYQDAKSNYNHALEKLAAAGSGAQDATFFNEVSDTWYVLEKRYDRRDLAIIFAMSTYIYNLLDTLIFYPRYQYPRVRASVDLLQDGQQPTLALGIKANF